jgi:phosphomannomutase
MNINNILDPTILREYDIRGIIGKTLSFENAYYIGKAFASIVSKKTLKEHPTIVIARDGRISSPELAKQTIAGMISAGAKIIDLKVAPTGMLYFAGHVLNSDAAIMITGSHNAPDYNGFKLVIANKPFFGQDIKLIQEVISKQELQEAKGEIISAAPDIKQKYLANLLATAALDNKLKIAWDPANGAAGEIIGLLCQTLSGEHIIINEKIDGNFPNHHPDPSVAENLTQLRKVLLAEKCDLGFAFDGDADRLVVLDAKGNTLSGEDIIRLFASDMLKKSPGATIIADVKASGSLFNDLTKLGAQALMWKTGHSFIKEKIAQTKAILAGEMSGHLFFADKYYGFDDGIYAAVRVIELMSRLPFSLDEFTSSMPERFISEEFRIDCDDRRKFIVIEEIKARLIAENINFTDIDGIRMQNNLGWWLIRASNTQGALVARCEAYLSQDFPLLKQQLKTQLAQSEVFIDF